MKACFLFAVCFLLIGLSAEAQEYKQPGCAGFAGLDVVGFGLDSSGVFTLEVVNENTIPINVSSVNVSLWDRVSCVFEAPGVMEPGGSAFVVGVCNESLKDWRGFSAAVDLSYVDLVPGFGSGRERSSRGQCWGIVGSFCDLRPDPSASLLPPGLPAEAVGGLIGGVGAFLLLRKKK